MQFSGGFLCETGCPVLADAPEFRCPAMHGAGGKVLREDAPGYAPCAGHDISP